MLGTEKRGKNNSDKAQVKSYVPHARSPIG
jgi:hypothetical protein